MLHCTQNWFTLNSHLLFQKQNKVCKQLSLKPIQICQNQRILGCWLIYNDFMWKQTAYSEKKILPLIFAQEKQEITQWYRLNPRISSGTTLPVVKMAELLLSMHMSFYFQSMFTLDNYSSSKESQKFIRQTVGRSHSADSVTCGSIRLPNGLNWHNGWLLVLELYHIKVINTFKLEMKVKVVAKAIRDHSQTLVGGADAKRGPLKFLTLASGPSKNYHKFSSKNWVYMLFYGVYP